MKVVSGTHEGATGMVVKVDQHVLIILSDTTKEHVRQILFLSFALISDKGNKLHEDYMYICRFASLLIISSRVQK